MKKFTGFRAIVILLLLSVQAVFAQQDTRSAALILKLSGENGEMQKAELYKSDIFKGRVKNLSDRPLLHSDYFLHMLVRDKNGEILADVNMENPLLLQLESFELDGSIERDQQTKNEGFVNLRFVLPDEKGLVSVSCYVHQGENSEKLISTLEFSPDEK